MLADGWFRTGDKGHVEAGDYLVISDRKKDVIISGGENVSSIEVEDCLFQHPAVAEVAVIGVPHEKWGETVKALVVLRAGQTRRAEPELDRALPGPPGPLQVPDVGRGPRRAAPHRHRQAAEVQAPQPLLGGLRPRRQLAHPDASPPRASPQIPSIVTVFPGRSGGQTVTMKSSLDRGWRVALAMAGPAAALARPVVDPGGIGACIDEKLGAARR